MTTYSIRSCLSGTAVVLVGSCRRAFEFTFTFLEPFFMFYIVSQEETGSKSEGYKWAEGKGGGELYAERLRERLLFCLIRWLGFACLSNA
jgi:hypothetical protein